MGRAAGTARKQQLRIIGGSWRSRRLEFPDAPGLRPTADRVRETLFNWLQDEVVAADCLDLFAGSGACGLEALSRGARSVTFVEKSASVAAVLRNNLRLLAADNAELLVQDALQALEQLADGPRRAFDIVFLDPPYDSDLLFPACRALREHDLLKAGARIFLESDKALSESELPGDWELLKSRRAGRVHYALCQNH